MFQIKVLFDGAPELDIDIKDTKSGKLFLNLFEDNLKRSFPVFRDPAKYTPHYLKELSLQIRDVLGWHWMDDDYSTQQTVAFHKHLETILEKESSFAKVPKKFHELLHETHFCIHAVQFKKAQWPHGTDIQIEWFNNDYADLPEDAEFKVQPEFGDVFMQNPYVGHGPFMCWLQNDYKNISRTCAFHDRVKPGMRINLTPNDELPFDWEKYESWWNENCKKFLDQHGFGKIKKYTGAPLLGKVKNLDVLSEIIKINVLNLREVKVVNGIR